MPMMALKINQMPRNEGNHLKIINNHDEFFLNYTNNNYLILFIINGEYEKIYQEHVRYLQFDISKNKSHDDMLSNKL